MIADPFTLMNSNIRFIHTTIPGARHNSLDCRMLCPLAARDYESRNIGCIFGGKVRSGFYQHHCQQHLKAK
jgi:hypothetical protein